MSDSIRSTTKAELRRRIALRLGDLVLLQATSGGSITNFIDVINIPTGNQDYSRRQGVFSAGSVNEYTRFVVTSTSPAGHLITINPPLPNDIAIGDKVELVMSQGSGFSLTEYDLAIEMAQDDAYPSALKEFDQILGNWSIETGTIGYDASAFREIYNIMWEDANSVWQPVAPASAQGYDGWYPNTTQGTIVISGQSAHRSDGYRIRAQGYGKHDPLTDDGDTTSIAPEWLIARACYHLCIMGMDRDVRGNRARLVQQFAGEAVSLKPMIWTQTDPRSVRVAPS